MKFKNAVICFSLTVTSIACASSPDKEIIQMIELAKETRAITNYERNLAVSVVKKKRKLGLCESKKPCYKPQFITDLILGNTTFHEKNLIDDFLGGFFEEEKDFMKDVGDKVKDVGRKIRKKFDENQRKRAEGIAENYKPHTREAKERERKKRLEEHNKLIEAKVGTGV